MSKKRSGLSKARFDKLFAVLSAALKGIADRAAKSVLTALGTHAADIAACNLHQLQELESRLHGSYGLQLHDALRKAAMFGSGQIKSHVYFNPGITWAKLTRMPMHDLQNLNDPNYAWAIKSSRNKVVQVASKDLTHPSTKALSRKLVSRFVTPEALPPSRQDDPRPRPIPTYYKLVSVDPDPLVHGAIVITCQLGNSSFKARLFASDVVMIQTTLTRRRKKAI
jgi:hypothetical protein